MDTNQKPNQGSAAGSGSSMGTGAPAGGAAGGTMAGGPSSSVAGRNGNGNAGGMAGHSAEQQIERGKQQLHHSIDEAAGAAQPLVDRLAHSAHAGVDRVSNALSGAGQSVSEKTQQWRDNYGQYLDNGRDYIRMNPATAVAGAFVAGWLLAKMFGGKERD